MISVVQMGFSMFLWPSLWPYSGTIVDI